SYVVIGGGADDAPPCTGHGGASSSAGSRRVAPGPRCSLLLRCSPGVRGVLEGGPRAAGLRDADDVAAGDQGGDPTGDDGGLPADARRRVHVVRTGRGPGGQAADVQLLVGDVQSAHALVHAEGREGAEVLVVVVHQGPTLHGAGDVVGD